MSDINPDVPDRPIGLPPGPALPQAATGSRDLLILVGALPALVAVFGTRDVVKIVAWISSDVGLQVAGVICAFGTMLWRQWLTRRQHADARTMNAFTPPRVSSCLDWHQYLSRNLLRTLLVMLAMVTALGAVLATSGCATLPTPSVSAVDRAEARYERVKAYADLILPFLPADHAARIRLAGRIAEQALAAARTAATVAEVQAELKKAHDATSDIDVAMGGSGK